MRWRVVPNYNSYIVSDSGIIVSNKTHRVLKQNNNIKGKGYLKVKLYNHNGHKQFYVHRLVAMLFLPKSNLSDIDHIDGNPKNNNVTNLEYVTHTENQRRAKENGFYNCDMEAEYIDRWRKGVTLIDVDTLKERHFRALGECSKWLGFNQDYISCKIKRKQFYVQDKYKIRLEG